MSLGRPRISVCGSINMDHVSYVRVAPGAGETVVGQGFHESVGGKGASQAVAAARAGGSVEIIGAVGDDTYGLLLRSSLMDAAVGTSGLRSIAGRTGMAHIVVDDQGENAVVVVPGANASMTGLTKVEEQRIALSDVFLTQLELPMTVVEAGLRAARGAGVKTVLTPAPVLTAPLTQTVLDYVDVLVPNIHEAEVLTGEPYPLKAAHALLDAVPEVVITLGADGCLHLDREGLPLWIPAFNVAAKDTSGARDTFVGAFTVARMAGRSVVPALRWASAAAAIAVQGQGATNAMPHRAEIDRLFAGTPRQRRPVD
ncbi:ribokinase [Streptomyces sp. TRM66268-LWL]|uniref:Ribokinase n=1 Tax=Streptomyces polyasparticus TaxID=2767826 RepID=A0ABR7SVW2_9ACTN|nr:ribokinase [Streptomyces polyasparticus]MBC9719647.1 ribokinase [Streptomyces polyasparticus]